MAKKKKLIVMVSFTVYGVEELLERIYAILTRFGYEVWMSHKGIYISKHWTPAPRRVVPCSICAGYLLNLSGL